MKTLTLACAFTLSGCAMTTQTSTTAPTEHSHAARPMASALPPKYLFVPQFKDCLSTRSTGSYQAWCMQPTKPERCPDTSWEQLKALQGHDQLPACPNEAPTERIPSP